MEEDEEDKEDKEDKEQWRMEGRYCKHSWGTEERGKGDGRKRPKISRKILERNWRFGDRQNLWMWMKWFLSVSYR